MSTKHTKTLLKSANQRALFEMRCQLSGVKPPEREPIVKDTTGDDIERVRQLNLEALMSTIARYRLAIPTANVMQWRATAAVRAGLTGFDHLGQVTILCTDGVVAWFLIADGRLFFGHKANFQGTVTQPFTTSLGTSPKGEHHDGKRQKKKVKELSPEQIRANKLHEQMLLED